MQDNIKLGSGGIREVEFIAQTFQLIRGGRNKRLQTQSLHQVLDPAGRGQCTGQGEQQSLWRAYEFLRNTEHAYRVWPTNRLSSYPLMSWVSSGWRASMGNADWQQFISSCSLTDTR